MMDLLHVASHSPLGSPGHIFLVEAMCYDRQWTGRPLSRPLMASSLFVSHWPKRSSLESAGERGLQNKGMDQGAVKCRSIKSAYEQLLRYFIEFTMPRQWFPSFHGLRNTFLWISVPQASLSRERPGSCEKGMSLVGPRCSHCELLHLQCLLRGCTL